MAIKLTFCTFVTLVASTGCEKRVEPANIEVVNRQQQVAEKRESAVENVKEGLTMKEVEAVLGAPEEVRAGKVTREVQKDFAFTTWVYRQDGKEIELSFIDGKLQGRVPQFGEHLNPQAPLQRKNGTNGGGRQETPKPEAR